MLFIRNCQTFFIGLWAHRELNKFFKGNGDNTSKIVFDEMFLLLTDKEGKTLEYLDFRRIGLKALMLAVLFVNIFCCFGFAKSSEVKIGLFYGGSVRSEYSVSANNNLLAGGASDDGFEEYFEIASKDVTVKKASLYHIEFGSGFSAEEAKERADEISESGVAAFVVCENGKFSVFGGSFENIADANAYAESLSEKGVVTEPKNNRLYAYDSKTKAICFAGDEIALASPEGRVKFTAVAGKEYRGAMLFVSQDSGITAINVVDREEYLYSVISREMSPSWHIEALKAQAVCARNYLENNRGKHSKYGFDLCDSVCCQAYAGTSAETEGSYPPVDETKGEILMYDGKIAQTFYSSSMGPTTEDVKYVWGSNFPYLSSVENPYEDYENVYNGKWEKTLTKERATEIMASKGYDIGAVTEIKALEYSPSGRVIKLLVKGTKGEKTFERESCRIVFSEVTLSQLYTISGGGEETFPAITVKSGSQKKTVDAKGKTVLSAKGKTSVGESFKVKGSSGEKKYAVTKSGDAYVFSGMGWGHGIGMSQYGAKGMAEAGFSYEEILTHYFKGTEVVKN